MKQYKNWKKLLVLILVLALALTTSLQASEGVSKDAAGAEEDVIIDETGSAEVISEEDTAPTADISSEGSFVGEITEIPTNSVPEEARADLEEDEDEREESKSDVQSVRFYLDWNGVDGLFGHCLTCTREYGEDGTRPKFTAEDAAVYNFNYKPERQNELEGKTSEEKWKFLEEKWATETFNGYKFLGWSTQPTGGTLITSDTDIVDDMSFYAYWAKDGKTNDDFQRIDPAAGPLEAIRIIAGQGTQFLSGTLHASKHAEANQSFTLDLFYTPVRAEITDITWSVAVSNKVTPEVLFGSAQKAEVQTVTAGGTVTVGAVSAKAEGCRLTVTSADTEEHVIVVSARAKGADGQEFTSLSDATLSFTHFWNEGSVTKDATCEEKGSKQYVCTACGATKTTEIPALQHVYNKSKSSNTSSNTYYTVIPIKEPTCTEDGENEYRYKCLRCGKEAAPERGKVPALGHDWSETVTEPASCNKDTETRYCKRCMLQEASLVPAYHPDLHEWTETERFHNTCMSDIVYERCSVCGETRSRTEDADNPDCHAYAYESSVRNDCYWVTYTFKCVYGCGSTQVTLKQEEGHAWGGWTASTSWDKATGAMTSFRKRTCSRCGKEETENLGIIPGQSETSAGSDTSASQPETSTGKQQPASQPETSAEKQLPASQTVNYTAGNVTAAAVAPAASSNTSSAKKSETKKSSSTKKASAAKKSTPAKTSFSYAKSKSKKKVTLKWKESSGATGYQVQYSKDKKFSSGVVSKDVKKLKLTVSKLKSKKTYYFRIRAYKKSGKTCLYSAWSGTKKVKVK